MHQFTGGGPSAALVFCVVDMCGYVLWMCAEPTLCEYLCVFLMYVVVIVSSG